MGSAVAPRKVEISKLSHRNYLYEARANKIDLGCTSSGTGGQEGGGREGKWRTREDKVKLKAVGQVYPYCWLS